jgi:hypothetical protein
MRFVSNRAHYRIGITEEVSSVSIDQNGNPQRIVSDKGFTAEFRQQELAPHEKLAAMQHWIGSQGNRGDGSMKGMGAHPLMQGMSLPGTTAWSPEGRFSMFDTANPEMCPPQYKAAAEAKLLDPQFNNNEHLLVGPGLVQKPWPSYDEMRGVKGKPTPDRIVDFALDLGLDLESVLAYESARESGPRPEVMAALRAAITSGREREAEDEALSAEVPA